MRNYEELLDDTFATENLILVIILCMFVNKRIFFFENTPQYILNSAQIPWGVEIQDSGQPFRSRHLGFKHYP